MVKTRSPANGAARRRAAAASPNSPLATSRAMPRMKSRWRAPTLAAELVEALTERVRRARLPAGHKLPTEAALMLEFGVSRTVVREALSRLQAAGLAHTRHGVGTFVAAVPPARRDAGFRVAPEQLATLQDVVALLELRIGVETEAAGLAAQRRSEAQVRAMRQTLARFAAAVAAGEDAVEADFALHQEIARATRNEHFERLLATLGAKAIPRARLDSAGADITDSAGSAERQAYLWRVHGEHESIVDAIAAGDADAARAAMRTHLANSRERRRRAGALTEAAAALSRGRPRARSAGAPG
jgi:DNA-binding FadR family transcriptional regulator